jgi:hypothetical protein
LGVKEEIAVWMDGQTTRPATNCQLELGLIQMFTSLVETQEDMEKQYKGINSALLSVIL